MKKLIAGLFAFALLAVTVIAACAGVDAPAENGWESKAPMPRKATGIKAATVNGKIYLFSSYATYMYDPSAETWANKTAMPTPRVSYAIAAVGNKVYVIGGQGNAPSDVNEVYDVSTDTWETKKPLSQPRTDMDANVVDGKIHVIGGNTRDGSNLHEVYDPATDSWTSRTPVYHERSYLSCVIDSKIYVISAVSNLFIYDAKDDSWSTGASLPEIYTEMGISAISPGIAATTGQHAPKRIYIIGGFYSPGFMSVRVVNFTYVYDPEEDSWSPAADMPTARSNPAVAVLNDRIYAMGGSLDSDITPGVQTAVVEVYTPFGYVAPPSVVLLNPANATYAVAGVPLEFAVDKAAAWLGYSLDGQDNVTVTGNVTLAGLANGVHSVAVYVIDVDGLSGASETVAFTVAASEEELFPTAALIITASGASAVFVAAGIIIYFKRQRRQTQTT